MPLTPTVLHGMKRMLILGGYGNAGRAISRLLLQHTAVRLVVAGPRAESAQDLASALNDDFPGSRVTARRVDAIDYFGMIEAFSGIDMVVVASSTVAHAGNVARAALDSGADYLDTQLSSPGKLDVLRQMQPEITDAGRFFVTDAGFHPGVPGALARHAAAELDRLTKANVAALIRMDWKELTFSEATSPELADELLAYRPMIFRNGRWKDVGSWTTERFDFGPPFGRLHCAPMFLEELRDLPQQIPELRDSGFFVAGLNPFVDYLVLPIGFAAMKVSPRGASGPVAGWLERGLRAFSRPPYRVAVVLEATGWKDGYAVEYRIRCSHDDGYFMTAAPVVACLRQYLEGTIDSPGLWLQASVVRPRQFLTDLEEMGVEVVVEGGVPAAAVT